MPSATQSALIPLTNQWGRQTTPKDTVAQKVHNPFTITKLVTEETEIQTHNKNNS